MLSFNRKKFIGNGFVRIVAVAALSISLLLPAPARVEAADAAIAAVGALASVAAYKSCLTEILRAGNIANNQAAILHQDMKENGRDPNASDIEVVDQVMNQLVDNGRYELRINSLPFMWAVNNSNEFNASCYPMNYISVNRGLVRGMGGNPDELAAVLGHEMTHGLYQHSAENYAKAVAQYYGLTFLNMATNAVDWNKMNGLVAYSIAKNVTLPTEYDADEGGFYLAASAGFNPGGGAAAMARMQDYFYHQTQDIDEYQTAEDNLKENFNDHPAMEKREARLASLLTDYSAGHVTVKDRKTVCIDGQPFIDADWDAADYDNTPENAYFIAGALAKAFHDYTSPEEWSFDGSGHRMTFLDDSDVNQALKKFTYRQNATDKLKAMVYEAYQSQVEKKGRSKLQTAEAKRNQAWEKTRVQALKAEKVYAQRLRENADMYCDLGMPKQAIFEINRAFVASNQDNEAECYAMRSRAKALEGDWEGAIADSDTAVAMDPKNAFNYLNRADVYHLMGDTDSALLWIDKAEQVDSQNKFVYYLRAQILEELGRDEESRENYMKVKALDGKFELPWVAEEKAQKKAEKEAAELKKQKDAEERAAKRAEASKQVKPSNRDGDQRVDLEEPEDKQNK